VANCHEPQASPADPPPPAAAAAFGPPRGPRVLGLPPSALILAAALGVVTLASSAVVAWSPFNAAAFGGLTVPTVLGAGVLDGLNPCAFALLVLFATYTLTLANSVTADGRPMDLARQRLLSAGALYVGAVWATYFIIGLGLFSFLGWLGQDHLMTRLAVILMLLMAIWMVKDVLLPGRGPALAAPRSTYRWMQHAIERGGPAGMLLAGVLVGICIVPCSGAIYLGIVAVLHASGGGPVGLALLSLYNVAFIAPLVGLLALVTSRRVLGRMGRWNKVNSPRVKLAIALAVIVMGLGLLATL
jgi:cytochrome c-type biogenesis protein